MLWRAERGCTDFVSDLFLYPFLGFCSEVAKIIQHYPESRMMCALYGGGQLSNMNSIHSTWYSAVKSPLEASPFTWGSRSASLWRCAGTEELPNTGSWASLSPAASATSAWCSSVSISEFNGEFQLLAIPGMDLPLSLLLQLGCF